MKILTGSKAAKTHILSFRSGSDTDLFSTHKQVGLDSGCFPVELLSLFEEESKQSEVATLNDLLTIKLSHLPYDIFWHKHMNDYLVFKSMEQMSTKSCMLPYNNTGKRCMAINHSCLYTEQRIVSLMTL